MTIQEIEARLAEIRTELESASVEQIETLSAEVDGLVTEREALKTAEEKRAAVRSMVATSAASASPVIPEARKEYGADSEEYRRAWLKSKAVFRSQDGSEFKMLGDMTKEEREAKSNEFDFISEPQHRTATPSVHLEPIPGRKLTCAASS